MVIGGGISIIPTWSKIPTVNGYDRYEDAIFRAREIMQERGWNTEITDTKEQCHEHLVYQHYRLKVLEITLSQSEPSKEGSCQLYSPAAVFLRERRPTCETARSVKPYVQQDLFPASSDPPATDPFPFTAYPWSKTNPYPLEMSAWRIPRRPRP
jgi:hypothetical protein